MRGEANQNVPAISKQAVVGLIVFIANRFFSFSFRVGKRRDRSKERSLRRGIRRGPIANSSEELSKGDRATCMKPSKCSPQTFKNHNLGYQNRSQVAAKTLWGTLGSLRRILERSQGGLGTFPSGLETLSGRFGTLLGDPGAPLGGSGTRFGPPKMESKSDRLTMFFS